MKTLKSISIALSAIMLLSVSAYAEHGMERGGGGYGHGDYNRGGGGYYAPRHVEMSRYNHGNWIIPLMVGGALGYALSEPRRESVTYIQSVPAPVVYQTQQPVYQEQWIYFSDCDCQRKVLVPVR
ncbi:MAG: hypothetical protein PHO27_05610 [Sulfuricurvum sp.]|nr:hypothetical protein [Sulfuricurvum sp.]